MFCRIRRKIEQSDGRNQVKRNLFICSNLLAATKCFTTTKECFTIAKLELRNTVTSGVSCSKEICSPRRSSSPLCKKGFVAAKPKQAKMNPWVRHNEDTLHHSEEVCRSESILRRNEGNIDQKVARGFTTANKSSPQ